MYFKLYNISVYYNVLWSRKNRSPPLRVIIQVNRTDLIVFFPPRSRLCITKELLAKDQFLSLRQHMIERYNGQLQVLKMWQIFVILSQGHILSIHEPPLPISCDSRRLDPYNVHALFVNMDNMWTERFGNYDCLVKQLLQRSVNERLNLQ